jgi:RND family efflux transporter MFP subunit
MKRPALLIPFLLLALASGACSKKPEQSVNAASKAPEAIAVKVAVAEARTVERSISVTGALFPDETTTVSSEVPGRITRITVDFGQFIRKGEVIAELDKQELQLQLERTRASLAQALARVGLEPNQLDVRPETTPMMKQAWNQMEDARSKYENAKKLVATGDIAQERFTELEKAYRAREAAFEMTRDDLRTQMAVIRSLKADVGLAEKRLKDATVIAPFDGIVQQKLVAAGQYIKDNVPIVTLVKTTPLRLRADIPESAVKDVRVGTMLVFTTDAVPGKEFHAVVRELNPALDARSRTLTAEARIVETDSALRAGTFVQVRLITAHAFAVVAVPRAAVFTVAGLNKVFTIENGKAVEHKIEDILGSNGFVEMPAGVLPAGVPVAISNLAALTNGAPVTIAGGKS